MKTQLRKLNLLFALSFLSPDMFYNIRVDSTEIYLQGRYNSDIGKTLMLKGSHLSVDDTGFIISKKSNLTITLT